MPNDPVNDQCLNTIDFAELQIRCRLSAGHEGDHRAADADTGMYEGDGSAWQKAEWELQWRREE